MENGVNVTLRIPVWLDRVCAWPMMLYRQWKYGYAYRKIDLGEREWAIVDPQDYYWLSNFKWSVVGYDEHIYAARIIRKTEYGRIKTVYLHREIMKAPKGLLVDHRNNDGLDNRRTNLRLATHSQNCCNRPKKANTSSRFTGVFFMKQRNRWRALIKHHRKSIFLGYYKNDIAAAKAYDEAAKKYHGEFARLNFPEEAPVS
jgi:hypothetical protein